MDKINKNKDSFIFVSKQTRLCPFKKIIERDYSEKTGKATINEHFAPCAGERCMAYYHGPCKRIEVNK